MTIKVCGITQLKQVQQLDSLDIDFAGFIFHPGSPRYVGDQIDADELQSADFDLRKVGVFVNASYDEIMDIVEEYGLDAVQLHGEETPKLCRQLSEELEVIKAFGVGNDDRSVDDIIQAYDDACDYYLFDTATKDGKKGGTGVKFDWDKLNKAKIEKPFFLSGGISLEDVAQIKAFKHPDFYGIDINSQFEKTPGVKDMALVLQLLQALKAK